MHMKLTKGSTLPLGVTVTKDRINFSVSVEQGKTCSLILYRAGQKKPYKIWNMPEAQSVGNIRFIAMEGLEPEKYEYNFLIDEKVVIDPYVKSIAGKEMWGREQDLQKHEIRGKIDVGTYDWEGDGKPEIPYHEVIAYSLHVRGFTKHSSSGIRHPGTFLGVVEKIPYLKELGINQIQCMPVYEFEECKRYRNYWGYGPAYIFAPKASYASSGDAVQEMKDMVKACHKAGIEVVLYFPFYDGLPYYMALECLRYYMMEYHVDGFILNPYTAAFEEICKDPVLGSVKIMKKQEAFQNIMRRFLKGDEGTIEEVIQKLKRSSKEEHSFNYITDHTGFTLADLVSYDGKHNEANGEQNQDGPDYNYSWNCGAEGTTRKKAVLKLRKNQVRNAFFLLLTAQGTPCILAGDEFGNTQKGNNNVYCQDNLTAWLDWRKLEKEKELFTYVKGLIEFRKQHAILAPQTEMNGMNKNAQGVPELSYHGEAAWQVPMEISSRQLGVYYCGTPDEKEDYYLAYNMHWLPHTFALPGLSDGKKWYVAMTTEEGILKRQRVTEDQKEILIKERSVAVLIGK